MSSESLAQELIQVERRGWDALCSGNAATYYREHLTEDALMAFPFGLMDREESLSAMAAAEPWSRYDMQAPRVISLGPRRRCRRVRRDSAARRAGAVLGGPE